MTYILYMDPTRSTTGIKAPEPPDFSCVRTLDGIVEHARLAEAVGRHELEAGDQVYVRTRNSIYRLEVAGDNTFVATGGWFDQHESPSLITVNGCTYGGSAIRQDVIAAPGLFLEFGNNVKTTRIQEVRVVRRHADFGTDYPN